MPEPIPAMVSPRRRSGERLVFSVDGGGSSGGFTLMVVVDGGMEMRVRGAFEVV